MKITEVLTAEHAALRVVVERMETACSQIKTPHEAELLADLVEQFLQHEFEEGNLLYVAYDHMLEERGQLQCMSQEHDELDQQLYQVRQAETVKQAKSRLRAALSSAKSRLRFEELNLLPAIERTLQRDTLDTLAHAT
jgi:hemerythrin-like domain-containing protein